jgi:hypothetical protein
MSASTVTAKYICEEGDPAPRSSSCGEAWSSCGQRGGQDVPCLLEPPASFEESAALGTGVIRWFSVRARGPVSLLALGKSDLDELILNFRRSPTKS